MRSSLSRGFFAATGAFALAAAAAAQGSNDCATATVIAGTGTFNVTTVGATDSPQQGTGCVVAHRDVWFRWTAPTTDQYELSTCGGASVDTVIMVYSAAGCPTNAQVISCNDDACGGLQSSTLFNTTLGATYMLQLGAFGTTTTYTGTFSIGLYTPPPGCSGATGPDVIVGDLTDVLNITPVAGVDAVALGTTSCNIGDTILAWVASTPAHPAIRQNVYKFKSVGGLGRFEQVGMSWLKHAFAVAPGSLCCPCTGSGNGMYPGCSDPYGSGLNGSQGGLGPNWQVNAHTGVFIYPPANPPWAGAAARRCQILSTDVEDTTSEVRYFGEGHYVTADDAASGNQNNNVSYRELSCISGTFGFTSSTQREIPAIRAWGVAESGVTITDVQIPGDGLLVTGSKATNLGGGVWHYEYAVYNMNSDRNVGSFSIPIPVGANVTNIGFHDVPFHDGDGNGNINFSGTDWVGSVSGGAIIWASQTLAANSNANAIRWGTMYNFRFDADLAPTSGVLTLGLWKPGTPTSVTSTGDVPGTSPFSPFCAGDGTTTACPCANNGTTGRGCANSSFVAGALLSGAGNPSVLGDTAVLSASSMTGATCVFFQGTVQQAPVVVDDGLGCVTGSVIRLGTKNIASNASSFPQVGDPLISVRGAIPGAGGTRFYQCFYRNASAAFCPPATSNRTNGVAITWAP